MASKQRELPTIERPKMRDIEDAADAYIETCDKLKRLGEDKKEGAEKLVIAMRRNKVRSYAFDGHLIVLEELEKVRVSAPKDEDADVED